MTGPAHGGHGATAALVLVGVLAVGYLLAAARDPRGWRPWRTVAWLAGCAALAVGVSPLLAGHDPRAHVAQHLLLGMLAPLGLVLAAPVTLLLRISPPVTGRAVVRLLRSRPARVLGHPVTAALLSTGGLSVIMLTPAHAVAAGHPLLHLHYVAAGSLFTWAIAGPDPAPHRPGPMSRAAVLVAAAGGHAFLAKVLYARAGDGAEAAAAQLMYYGGDVAELMLATALFAGWYRRRGRDRVAPAWPGRGKRWDGGRNRPSPGVASPVVLESGPGSTCSALVRFGGTRNLIV
jgi:putative membrane protein